MTKNNIKNRMKHKVEVSVCMTTYYHEKYLEQALDSVLMQKVSFDYEIVISDDCSKDKTQMIILDYAKKNDNIRYNFNESNIGLTENVCRARSMCKGKYIIDLSGDDYWIDERKMQKQHDFLENHPNYFAVSTMLETRMEFSKEAIEIIPDIKLCKREFTLDMFLKGECFPENGMMIKNPFLDCKLKKEFLIMPKMSKYIDDITDNFLLLKNGKAYIMDEITIVYRIRKRNSENMNFNSVNNYLEIFKKTIDNLNNLYDVYGKKYSFYSRYKLEMATGYAGIFLNNGLSSFISIFNTIPKEYKGLKLIFGGFFSLFKLIIKKITIYWRKIW